jgi:hypothetical protein
VLFTVTKKKKEKKNTTKLVDFKKRISTMSILLRTCQPLHQFGCVRVSLCDFFLTPAPNDLQTKLEESVSANSSKATSGITQRVF